MLINVNFNVTNQTCPVRPVKLKLKCRASVADQRANLIASFAMCSGSVLSHAGKCLTVEYTLVVVVFVFVDFILVVVDLVIVI